METMMSLDERFVELIWERKEVVVSMDEIAKLVGCSVSQLKIIK
jgi:DNA-directed RNA polymerase specialized sigma24 family protein